MSRHDPTWAAEIATELTAYERAHNALPGITSAEARRVLIQQLIDSIHRVNFVRTIATRPVSPLRIDPDGDLFDPLRAAILAQRGGETDEAFWLVFLATHCGRNRRTGWRLPGELYAGDGPTERWTWVRVAHDPAAFSRWLAANAEKLRGQFGNHRKYESLRDDAPRSTGAVVENYVNWVARLERTNS